MANCVGENMWTREIAEKFSYILNDKARVLEIGSAIANHKVFFKVGTYLGLDIAEAPGVDIVSIAHEYKGEPSSFDAVCSFSELEHDMHWKKTLKKMAELTKQNGLVFFSCCYNWEEHGTLRTSPEQSLTTKMGEEWGNYYRNITPDDIRKAWKIDKLFGSYQLGRSQYHDGFTVFWGIREWQ
jgi:SAM-dependent methyltransferase